MTEGEGFLGRWSRRKSDAREGRPLDEPPQEVAHAAAPGGAPPARAGEVPAVGSTGSGQVGAAPGGAVHPAAEPPVQAPPPTMEDAAALTPQSDFKPFMSRAVAPEVRNAAMKKLFSDPHFNIMDGLDTYIDDYSRPDPVPESMLRQLASAKFLNLFEEEPQKDKERPPASQEAAAQGRDVADAAPAQTVAQSYAKADISSPPSNDDAHTDLRLQPDHAAGPPGPGRGAA